MTKPNAPVTPARPQPAPARVGAVAPSAPLRADAPVTPVPAAPVQAAVARPATPAVPKVPVAASASPIPVVVPAPVPAQPAPVTQGAGAAPAAAPASPTPVVVTAPVPAQPAPVPVVVSRPEPTPLLPEHPVPGESPAGASPVERPQDDPWATPALDAAPAEPAPSLSDLIPPSTESTTTPESDPNAKAKKTKAPRLDFKKKSAPDPLAPTGPGRPTPSAGLARATTALKAGRFQLPKFGRATPPAGTALNADDAVSAPIVDAPTPVGRAKRPLPRAAVLGLTAALLIGGALLARQLLTPAPAELSTTLEQITPLPPTVIAPDPTGQTPPGDSGTSGSPAETSSVVADSGSGTRSAQTNSAVASSGSGTRPAQATTAPPQASANTPATAIKPVKVKPRSATTPTTDLTASSTNPVAGRIVRPDPLLARTFGSGRTGSSASTSTAVQTATANTFQNTTPTNAGAGGSFTPAPRSASVASVPLVSERYGSSSPPPAAPIPVARVPQPQPIPAPVPVSTPSLLPPVTARPAVNARVPMTLTRPATIRLPDPTPLPPIALSRPTPTTPSTPPLVMPNPVTPPTTPSASVSVPPPTTVVPSVSTDTPPVTSTPASLNAGIRYLGYVSGETPIAIIDVQGRSETLSEGQPIPGTTLTVNRVTPSALKVSAPDEAPTSLPLEVTP
jgi:hypothetical protein